MQCKEDCRMVSFRAQSDLKDFISLLPMAFRSGKLHPQIKCLL